MCAEATHQEKERIKSKIGKVKKLNVMLQKGYHDLPKRTGTDRNGLELTETDLRKYRNGLLWVPKRTGTDFSGYRNGSEQTSAHTETNFN